MSLLSLFPQNTLQRSQDGSSLADFFTINVTNFFDEIEDNASSTRVCSLFECHPGQWVANKRSTYYDHCQHWQEETLEAKQIVLSAGQMQASCWSNLMLMTPAPQAHIKAVCWSQVMTIELNVIEISSDLDHKA